MFVFRVRLDCGVTLVTIVIGKHVIIIFIIVKVTMVILIKYDLK